MHILKSHQGYRLQQHPLHVDIGHPLLPSDHSPVSEPRNRYSHCVCYR